MPRRERGGLGRTALQEPSKTMSSDTARIMLQRTPVSESVNPPQPPAQRKAKSLQSRIKLWLNNGCPLDRIRRLVRAEAMLNNALVAKCEDRRNVHRSPAAVLAPSPKWWSSSDGGHWKYGK